MAKFTVKSANVYDETIANKVPGYRLGQEVSAAYLLGRLPAAAHILVIGAGTGEELLLMAEQAPGWTFTAVDPSEGMLARAREKVAERGYEERVQFHTASMEDASALPAHDAAIGLLVTQFVADDGAKERFYSAVAQALKPGAPFVTIDFVEGDEHTRAGYRQWAVMQGASETAADSMMRRVMENWHPVSRPRMMALCETAGLTAPRHHFMALNFAGHIFERSL